MATRGAENNFRTSTQKVAAQEFTSTGTPLIETIADLGKQIIQRGQEAKVNENFSNAQVEVNQLDRQFQVDFAHDPFNKQGLEKLKQDKSTVFTNNEEGISPFFKRPYNTATRDLNRKSEAVIEGFGYTQTRKNTVTSMNRSIQNNLSQAAIDGESGVNLGAAMINFTTSKGALLNTADGILGESEANALLADFNQDYLKTYLSGKAVTDPVGALQLMESDEVKDSFADQKQYNSMKKAIENKVLNVGKVRVEQEVLSSMTSADSLFARSSQEKIPYATLQQEYAVRGTSKEAQKVINKMNGYGATSKDILTPSQKTEFNVQLFEDIAQLGSADTVDAKDLQIIQNRIYEGLDNKSLTSAAGTRALGQLIQPSIKNLEDSLETFDDNDLIPFNENGFEEVVDKFKADYEIKEKDSSLSKRKLKEVNNKNKLRYYESYNAALIQHMPAGTPVGDIGTLTTQKRDSVLKNAKTQADNDYAFKSFGYVAKETDTEQGIKNIIQSEQTKVQRTASQNVVDEAYKTPPVTFRIQIDASGNKAKVFPDGTFEEID